MFKTKQSALSLISKLPKLTEMINMLIKLYPCSCLRKEREATLVKRSKLAFEQFKKKYKKDISDIEAQRLGFILTLVGEGDLQYDLPTLIKMNEAEFLSGIHTLLSSNIANAVSYSKVEAMSGLLNDKVKETENRCNTLRASN